MPQEPTAQETLPEFSFIVCTRDRPQKLLACVASIVAAIRQGGALSEIIVVENGSRAGLTVADEAVDAVGGGICRLIRLHQGSLSEARNVGILQSRGSLLVFSDDDCLLDPSYLSDALRHRAAMAAQGVEHFLIGGRVRLGDPQDLPFTIKDHDRAETFGTGVHPGGFIQGCNFMLPRATAAKIGWFDLRFGAGARFRAGEDTDYLIRAHAAGVLIRYVPDMGVRHLHGRRTFAEVDRLNRNYAFANGAILAKHMRHHPWLAKHLGWTIRSTLMERIGGPKFDVAVGLTWGSVTRAQLRGMLAFVGHRLRRGGTLA